MSTKSMLEGWDYSHRPEEHSWSKTLKLEGKGFVRLGITMYPENNSILGGFGQASYTIEDERGRGYALNARGMVALQSPEDADALAAACLRFLDEVTEINDRGYE